MYQESLPFLYRNTFRLSGLEISALSRFNPVFQSRVRALAFWWGGSVRDSAVFRHIARFPQLKTLKLTYYAYHPEYTSRTWNRNTLYQDDEGVRWGPRRGHGFDSLVQLRGLDKVIVEKGYGTIEENKAFEAFLMRILTMPKEVSISKKPRLCRS
jgi:hypothetical protein